MLIDFYSKFNLLNVGMNHRENNSIETKTNGSLDFNLNKASLLFDWSSNFICFNASASTLTCEFISMITTMVDVHKEGCLGLCFINSVKP